MSRALAPARSLTVFLAAIAMLAVAFVPAAEAFEDTEGNGWHDAVQALVDEGVLYGCGEDRFCPDGAIQRGQMASILVRALELPEAEETDRFDDVADTTHEDSINALAEAGITRGCTDDAFCPGQALTRAEMATLIARAFEVAEVETTYFDDVRGTHAPAIDGLADTGIAAGCGDPLTAFCPHDDVLRWQGALFVARAMDLIDRVEVSSLEHRRERQAEIDAEREAAEREAEQQRVAASRAQTAVDTALAQVGKPYQWGGNGPSSFDCSGLTRYAWRNAGVELPRTSRDQYSGTTRISRSQLQPGDLVFYGRSGITHVAMYIGGGDIVEAPYSGQNVRVSSTGLSRSDIVGYGRPA